MKQAGREELLTALLGKPKWKKKILKKYVRTHTGEGASLNFNTEIAMALCTWLVSEIVMNCISDPLQENKINYQTEKQ